MKTSAVASADSATTLDVKAQYFPFDMNQHSHPADGGLKINDSNETFAAWANRELVPQSLKDRVRLAQVLLIPDLERHPDRRPLFPVGTDSLFSFLQQRIGTENVELPLEDSDYAEIALHADVKRLGIFLVNGVVLTLFLNVLANYVYDRIRPTHQDTIVFSITVTDGAKSKNFQFSGGAEEFKKAAAEIEKLWRNESDNKGD